MQNKWLCCRNKMLWIYLITKWMNSCPYAIYRQSAAVVNVEAVWNCLLLHCPAPLSSTPAHSSCTELLQEKKHACLSLVQGRYCIEILLGSDWDYWFYKQSGLGTDAKPIWESWITFQLGCNSYGSCRCCGDISGTPQQF